MSGPAIRRPSDYSPGGYELVQPPDTHHDPTPEEREAERRADLIMPVEAEKMFATPFAFNWLLDRKLLGTVWNGETDGVGRTNKYLSRAAIARGLDEFRAVAGALPPHR